MSKDKLDISIKEISRVVPYGFKSGSLTLQFSGNDINIKMINTLRRISCNNIPTYAFPRDLITIEENTCVAFNNDYMKLRILSLPILNLDTDIFFLHEQYWRGVNYADPKREKHPSELPVELYCNAHNNSNVIKNITTNDIRYYVDGVQMYPYDKEDPWVIVKLRPNDTFKCHAKGALGIGENKACWNAARNSFYDYSDDGKTIVLTVQSAGQMSEYSILRKACSYTIKKMEDIGIELQRRFDTKELIEEKTMFFVLDGEDHSIGELLNYELQSHPEIIFSGNTKPDHLIKSVTIKTEAGPKIKSPLNAVRQCISSLTNKFTVIRDKLVILDKNKEDTQIKKSNKH
jgi:DNA-directed RNA polymerase subunit L